jgi:arylsulfatase A-like enzyme
MLEAGKVRIDRGFWAAILLLLTAGCSTEEPGSEGSRPEIRLEEPRGIILISIDTLRADHLGAYGYELPTSPVFDRLAERGTLFERAVVQYPSTLTSHMSIFTGLYPQEHQVLPPSTVLSESIRTLPELFQASGFRTAGHTEGGFVAGGYGFSRGFDEFTDTAYQVDTDIERTFERGLEFLRSLREGERFFLFLHTYSVHDPYEPPEEFQRMFWSGAVPATFSSTGENLRLVNKGELDISPEAVEYFRSMYDASIRYADDVLGRFVEEVEALDLMEVTTWVLTSDHGEEFQEHSKMAHTQVYPESLLVPLLMLHPGVAGRRVSQVVESIDLAPTLLQLAGIEPGEGLSGRSLMPFLGGSPVADQGSQGYAEVLDVEFVRTVLAQDRGQRYQLVMVEPEWDPVGSWIRDRFTFDVDQGPVRFEGQSFHQPRRVRIEIAGEPHGALELRPGWQPVEIELPNGEGVQRVTLIADGCVSPAAVGEGEDGRCLAFQVRNFAPRRFELYDLETDPLAQRDLFREQPKIRLRLAERLLSMEWKPRGEAGDRLLSAEDEATLKALGYLD